MLNHARGDAGAVAGGLLLEGVVVDDLALGAVLVADGARDDEGHAVELGGLRDGAALHLAAQVVDLCNGEIVGHSEGPRRDARALSQALGLRALVQQLQDPLDAGLHVAGRVRGGGAVPPGIVQISVANP